MASKFDDYLKQANFSPQQKDAMAEMGKTGQEANHSPSDTKNTHTPNPKDTGKPIDGVENTGTKDSLGKYNARMDSEVKNAGKTLENNGVKADKAQQQTTGKEPVR